MTSIIFGVNGQDGHYLTSLLQSHNHKVIGVSRSKGEWLNGDVANHDFTTELIKVNKPEYIFHLAANSSTSHLFLFENHETISTGTLNILEAAKRYSPLAKIFLSGSAMQFKNEGLPINEQTPFEASSPYSIARIQSVYAGRYYRRLGLSVYVGYFFNHDSPLRGERHVNQKIVRAAQRIAGGSNELLELGSISVSKEFNFAGDSMEAIWTLVNQEKVFEAIIGSGEAYSIEQWVESCFNKLGLNWRNNVIIKENFVPEYHILVGDPTLIKSLGWQPKISFTELADLMLSKK